jgi:hypothetical protein
MRTASKPQSHWSRFGWVAAVFALGVGVPARFLPQMATAAELASLQTEVTTLRPSGPQGLQTFLQRHAQELAPGKVPPAPLGTALDQLCQMKDCYASRLYWYTDLEAAKAAAQASGKPILSLRLLGNLDQDLSCANSRFFRVALYPNAAIAQLLRERFILHWQSERPVPKVTIDFGNGRTLERTITGNSIHYILAADGRPLEAIPGLYGPQAFLGQLQQSLLLAEQIKQCPSAEQLRFLQQYHQTRLTELQRRWRADLQRVGVTVPPQLVNNPSRTSASPNAVQAGRVAVTKMNVEFPVLLAMQAFANQQRTLTEITDQQAWQKLAQLYLSSARLDTNSVALIQQKKTQGAALEDTPIPLSAIVQNLETAIALDTVRNEYMLHGQLHQWFIQSRVTGNLARLNATVYQDLFLTPANDPWLGLLSPDSFSAIDRDGLNP